MEGCEKHRLKGWGFLQLERSAKNMLHSTRESIKVSVSPKSALMNEKRVQFVGAVRDLRPSSARKDGRAGGREPERTDAADG